MTPEWLEDGRKIPDDVMYYIRRMAVYAVRVLGQSPEKVAEAYNSMFKFFVLDFRKHR